MKRAILMTSIVLFTAAGALAQNDEEILETLRTSVTNVYLEELPNELPKSFHTGLASSDKEQIIRQLVDDCAACFVDAVVKYAALFNVPLSDFVTDGVVVPGPGLAGEFEQLLNPCIIAARQEAGIVESER
jgi:hypothetical protein